MTPLFLPQWSKDKWSNGHVSATTLQSFVQCGKRKTSRNHNYELLLYGIWSTVPFDTRLCEYSKNRVILWEKRLGAPYPWVHCWMLSLRVMERLLSKKVQKMMISLSLPSKVMHVLSSRPVHPKEKMQTSEWSSRIVRKRLRYEFLSVKHESQKAFQRISFLYWIPTVFFGQLRSRKKVLYLDMPHFNHNVLWLFFVI